DFVLRQVVPRVPYLAGPIADWSVEIARVTPSRLTLRYIFDHRVTVYGKAYREAGPGKSASLLPSRAFHTIRGLWEYGFGRDGLPRPGSTRSDPQPLRAGLRVPGRLACHGERLGHRFRLSPHPRRGALRQQDEMCGVLRRIGKARGGGKWLRGVHG